MKRLFVSTLLVALCAVAAPSAHAGCSGTCSDPGKDKWHVTNVAWIKANENDLDRDDDKVALIGKVTKKHSDHVYFFQDETGTIQLDSDIELPVGKTIVIRGRIDQAFLHIGPLEVNVDSWRPIGKYGVYNK
ncbi:MAG TPA: NirD/YgiW/YdeI family stress tolerance protein [Candidatus Methylacidiphilales bacterium]